MILWLDDVRNPVLYGLKGKDYKWVKNSDVNYMGYDTICSVQNNAQDRKALYENINTRVDLMFEKGLIDEVKDLLNKYELSVTAKVAIGYK